MVFITGANSLDHALNSIRYRQQKLFRRYCYSLPGLSFNSNAKNSLKMLQNLLNREIFSRSRELNVCHDISKNSISAHKSNNKQTCTTSQLVETLLQRQTRIEAIVYRQRSGTENIRKKLFELASL